VCVCMCACVLVDGWADDEYACPHACMHMHMQTRARHIKQELAGKASFATAAAAAATALQLTACRGEQPPPQVEQGRSVRMAQPTHTGHVRWLHRKISAAGFIIHAVKCEECAVSFCSQVCWSQGTAPWEKARAQTATRTPAALASACSSRKATGSSCTKLARILVSSQAGPGPASRPPPHKGVGPHETSCWVHVCCTAVLQLAKYKDMFGLSA
jgi:hypothetical protein